MADDHGRALGGSASPGLPVRLRGYRGDPRQHRPASPTPPATASDARSRLGHLGVLRRQRSHRGQGQHDKRRHAQRQLAQPLARDARLWSATNSSTPPPSKSTARASSTTPTTSLAHDCKRAAATRTWPCSPPASALRCSPSSSAFIAASGGEPEPGPLRYILSTHTLEHLSRSDRGRTCQTLAAWVQAHRGEHCAVAGHQRPGHQGRP
jgi:hypothetical protein